VSGTGRLRIDGSHGEGGGQILRTALALSAILGRPVELVNVRAGRRNPGLQAQHLACVKALARITRAEVGGAELGSTVVQFSPGPVVGGSHRCDVGTAGSVSLIFQMAAPVLAFGAAPSDVTITGGTHVPWSPPAPYLSEVFLPAAARMGLAATWDVERAGFYPKGGGAVRATVRPIDRLRALDVSERGRLLGLHALSVVARLPRRIAERQAEQARRRLADAGYRLAIRVAEVDAPSPGDALFLWAEFERSRAGFGALGERGKPAERVGDEAAEALLDFLAGSAATDHHLADQLVLLMALAGGNSVLTTSRVTEHLLTNIWAIRQFLPLSIGLEGRAGEPGRLVVEGAGLVARATTGVAAATD
jgi:RNA 3'-terminal phosphate cyclase (ATP)